MTRGVPDILFGEVLFQGGSEVYTGLVGDTEEDPEGVGEFVSQFFASVRRFEGLVAVEAAHEAGHFPHFFREDSHISELAEIADPGAADPVIDQLLGFADRQLGWDRSVGAIVVHVLYCYGRKNTQVPVNH